MTNYAKLRKAFVDLPIGARFTSKELMELAQVGPDAAKTASAVISTQLKMDLAVQDGKKGRYILYKKLGNPRSVTQ